jgi:hypothetical protein
MKTKETKQKEAAARQAKRNGRTDEQQLTRLQQVPGAAAKEINRLEIRIRLNAEIQKQAKGSK